MGMAILVPPLSTRLVARRRSRCWKCDGQMQHRRFNERNTWWCPKCAHVVWYGTNDHCDKGPCSLLRNHPGRCRI